MADSEDLLKRWDADRSKYPELQRPQSAYNPMDSYILPRGEQKHYMQQFGDMYFLRLAKLKPVVEAGAEEAWSDFEIGGEQAKRVDRVLDVRQGQLCWVAGTIYMELPLKPSILEDISREHWIARPPPRKTYYSADNDPHVMLEDESGRLRLTGTMLQTVLLVTGVIAAVLGTENADGEFEVLDLHVADLPRQPQRWERDESGEEGVSSKMELDRPTESRKIALVSGLSISGTEADSMNLALLSEYLIGEALGPGDQTSATSICRLIIAGNSISSDITTAPDASGIGPKKATQKKYGYDSSSYNPTPTARLDEYLSEILPSLPITIMPGEHDPANVSLPQQPTHPAMFPHSRAYAAQHTQNAEDMEPGWFDSVTNPWEGDVEGWRLMGNSGQPIDDILKYINLGADDGHLEVMENILRWRCGAPTAPDTLCEPFHASSI